MIAIPPFTFAKVPPIHFGTGKITQLPQLIQQHQGQRVLLVTGSRSLQASGQLARITALLDDASLAHQTVICPGEPTTDLIDQTCQEYRGQEIDVVVAIGGG